MSGNGAGMDLDAQMRAVFEKLSDTLIAELGEERALELMEKDDERLRGVLNEGVKEITETSAYHLAESLKEEGPAMLARRRAERRGFEARLARRWAHPFDLAEMTMVVAYEVGEDFNERHQRQAEAEQDPVFDVLVRLHARACRIAEEVLALLRAGFGQAALARWRALHEVAVVASFISEHDQDTAERYLLHENIEAWRGMEELQARHHLLNEEPFSEEERRKAKEVFDELVQRYGKKYAGAYGWAHAALVKEDTKYERTRVTFQTIEQAVSLDHLRPYYRMASHGTHANPKGILFTPDMLESEPEVLLAGPGSTGFADPGQCALISLSQVTATLLTYKDGEATPLILITLLRLTDEAAHAYAETQRAVEKDENVPRYGPVARLRYWAGPHLAAERVRVRRLVRAAWSKARKRRA
jgi:hypothetical protein